MSKRSIPTQTSRTMSGTISRRIGAVLVLGIDPGTYNMGVGIVNAEGDSLTFVHADVLKVRRDAPRAERLHRLHTELISYIAQHKPDEIAIEEPFVARNVRSAIAVGQAQAVANDCCGGVWHKRTVICTS